LHRPYFSLNIVLLSIPYYIAIVGNKIVGWCDISFSDKQTYPHTGYIRN